MTDVDRELFESDYPEVAEQLRQIEIENAALKQENDAMRGQTGEPKNDDKTPEWTPPSYDDISSATDEAFEAHRSGAIDERELIERVNETQKMTEPPAPEPVDPNAGKSAAEIERETDAIFNSAESESELMAKLGEAGALDRPAAHTR